MSTVHCTPAPHINNRTNTNTNKAGNDGDTSVSFVDGTPSSRSSTTQSAAKRDRRRSGSPHEQAAARARLTPAPPHQQQGSRTARADEENKASPHANRTERYIFRQYIAFQPSSPPTTTTTNSHSHPQQQSGKWQEAINESVQREAEYLLDEGSQLVRGEVRDAFLRSAGSGSRRSLLDEDNGGREVQWRNIVVPCLTMDDIRIDGHSWTYQPAPPPRNVVLNPEFAIPDGMITGIPLADLPEWEKSKDVGEAFSPARRLQARIALPVHETTVNGEEGQGVQRVAEGMMLEGLGSPFDSQQQRKKRKADDLTSDHQALSPSHANTKTPLPPDPPPRQPTLLDYVPVNDLPEWEWWYDPAPPVFVPESAGQQNESHSQSQTQSVRESLRRPWNNDDERASPAMRQTGIDVSVSRIAAESAIATSRTGMGTGRYRHEQVADRTTMQQQMASYITDPSIAPTPTPSSNSHNRNISAEGSAQGTAYEADGRIFRRMPVVLPNLDHERMKLLTDANVNVNGVREAGMGDAGGKATKGGKRSTKEYPQAEGAANKRVMQLQNIQPQRQHRPQQQVRPIKSFLPMPLFGVPHPSEGVNNATQDVEGTGTCTGNDSIMGMDDISMAESTHMAHQSTEVDISVVESTRVEHHSPVADVTEDVPAVAGHPMIFVEGQEAVFSSPVAAPSRPAGFTPVVLSKAEMDRRRILKDPARYGRHYEIIEEHKLGILSDAATHVHIPPELQFIEPIPALPAPDHPFHPALMYYIAQRPYARVQWLIPVHGPVTIPGLSEKQGMEGFFPSAGYFALGNNEYNDIRRRYRQPTPSVPGAASSSKPMETTRPRPLVLTDQILRGMWNKLVRLRELGRCGPIALALASSQPDPFRPTDHDHSSFLERHKCLVPSRAGEPTIDHDIRPVKPEVGDHIKLLCDLRYALAIRFVLKGMQVGDGADSASHSTVGNQVGGAQASTGRTRLAPTHSSATSRSSKSTSKPLVPFRGVKLCLVGDRGEVLTVV